MWLSLTLIFGTDRCGSLTRSLSRGWTVQQRKREDWAGSSDSLLCSSLQSVCHPGFRSSCQNWLESILKLNLAYSLLKVNICPISTPGAEIGTESMIRLQLWLGFRSKATTEVILGQIHAFLHANITFLSEVVRRAISGAVLILHKSWI